MPRLEPWSEEHRALVRSMLPHKPMPEDDFTIFWAKCVQSGLDPLLDQCHAVARQTRSNIPVMDPMDPTKQLKEQGSGGKWWPVWEKVTTYTFQPAESGMLARAMGMKDCLGVQAGAVHEQDHIVIDQSSGKVEHTFSPTAKRGKLVGAWGRCIRDGKLPDVVWVPIETVSQGGDFWAKMPGTMVAKCARVAAIRKAYPEKFGGMHIAEEMPTSGAENDAQLDALTAPISGTRPVMDAGAVQPATPSAREPSVEVVAIIEECKKVGPGTTQDEYMKLRQRIIDLPPGTDGRALAVAAITEAHERRKVVVHDEAAEREADVICGEAEAIAESDPDGLAKLRERALKLPDGPRTRALAVLDKGQTGTVAP